MNDAEIAGYMDWRGPGAYTNRQLVRIRRIVEEVQRREREACAKLVEDTKEWKGAGWVSTLCQYTKRAIAAAIRARGQA